MTSQKEHKQTKHRHHYHSFWRRGFYSFVLVFFVMAVGMTGIHFLERVSWVKSFYLMSMLATAQGLTFTPETPWGMIFVSIMAFIAVGSVVATLGFLLGPFFGKLVKVGIEKFEDEIGLR